MTLKSLCENYPSSRVGAASPIIKHIFGYFNRIGSIKHDINQVASGMPIVNLSLVKTEQLNKNTRNNVIFQFCSHNSSQPFGIYDNFLTCKLRLCDVVTPLSFDKSAPKPRMMSNVHIRGSGESFSEPGLTDCGINTRKQKDIKYTDFLDGRSEYSTIEFEVDVSDDKFTDIISYNLAPRDGTTEKVCVEECLVVINGGQSTLFMTLPNNKHQKFMI